MLVQESDDNIQKNKPLPQLICSPSGNYLKGSCTGKQLSPFFPKKRVVLQIKKTPFPWFPEHVTSESTAPTALGAGQCTELTWPTRGWHRDGTPLEMKHPADCLASNSWSGHANRGVQEELCLSRRRRKCPLQLPG